MSDEILDHENSKTGHSEAIGDLTKYNQNDRDILTAAKGGGISFIGLLFVFGMRLIFGVVVARLLGAEGYGLYTLGFTIITTLSLFSVLGLSEAAVRYIPIAVREKHDSELLGIIQVSLALPFIISLVLAGLLLLLAEPIAYLLFDDPQLTQILRLFSISLPFLVLTRIFESINRGFKKMQYIVYSSQITFHTVKMCLTIFLIFVGLAVIGVVIAFDIAAVIAFALLVYFTNKLYPLKRSWNTANRKSSMMLKYSIPIYLSQLISKLGSNLEIIMLGILGTTMGVGIYAATYKLSVIGIMFSGSIIEISAPIISDIYSRDEGIHHLQNFIQTITRWSVLLNIPIFLTLVLFSESLLTIFGEEFAAGTSALIILAFGFLISAIALSSRTVINMSGHTRLSFINSVIFLGSNLVLDLLLIPTWGVTGAALAVTLSIVLVNTLRIGEVYYLLRIIPFNVKFLKPIAAGVFTIIITYFVNTWLSGRDMILQVIIGMFVLWSSYIIFLILLKFSEEDLMVMKKVKTNLTSMRFYP